MLNTEKLKNKLSFSGHFDAAVFAENSLFPMKSLIYCYWTHKSAKTIDVKMMSLHLQNAIIKYYLKNVDVSTKSIFKTAEGIFYNLPEKGFVSER